VLHNSKEDSRTGNSLRLAMNKKILVKIFFALLLLFFRPVLQNMSVSG